MFIENSARRPMDTPFEDGTFRLTLEEYPNKPTLEEYPNKFTEEYPNKPPTVKFKTKMFHPNVYADGGICLDILQNRWSPKYDVSSILTSIQVFNWVFVTVFSVFLIFVKEILNFNLPFWPIRDN